MQSEKNLKDAVLRMIKKHYPNVFVIKLSDKWFSGIPDILVIYNGNIRWIELKTLKGDTEPIQDYMFAKLAEVGTPVAICRTVEHAKEVLKCLLKENCCKSTSTPVKPTIKRRPSKQPLMNGSKQQKKN